jgi:hypothetical protein
LAGWDSRRKGRFKAFVGVEVWPCRHPQRCCAAGAGSLTRPRPPLWCPGVACHARRVMEGAVPGVPSALHAGSRIGKHMRGTHIPSWCGREVIPPPVSPVKKWPINRQPSTWEVACDAEQGSQVGVFRAPVLASHECVRPPQMRTPRDRRLPPGRNHLL